MYELILATDLSLSLPLVLAVIVIVLAIMLFAGAVFGLLVITKWKMESLQSHFTDSLEDLNLQLEKKTLTDEMYRWMRTDLEKAYLKFFEKDLK